MQDRYVTFYVMGRCEGFDTEVDIDAIVAKLKTGLPFRHVTLEAAQNLLTKAGEMNAATKIQWLKDNADEIREAGADTEKAWRRFSEGRTDGLAWQIEEATMEALVNQAEEEDEDEEEEEDEDGDEEGDDDDEEEDEEDDEEEED